jgi:hypothetical protein
MTRNLAAGGYVNRSARVRVAGRVGPSVLRLVRQDLLQRTGQVSGTRRADLIRPHERSISGTK